MCFLTLAVPGMRPSIPTAGCALGPCEPKALPCCEPSPEVSHSLSSCAVVPLVSQEQMLMRALHLCRVSICGEDHLSHHGGQVWFSMALLSLPLLSVVWGMEPMNIVIGFLCQQFLGPEPPHAISVPDGVTRLVCAFSMRTLICAMAGTQPILFSFTLVFIY